MAVFSLPGELHQGIRKSEITKMVMVMEEKRGIRIIREMVDSGLITRYRLADEMGVKEKSVQSWYKGLFFDENKHIVRLMEVRDKYMRAKGMGIYKDK